MEKKLAREEFKSLSSGTLGGLFDANTYEAIEESLDEMLMWINSHDVSNCTNWIEVWNLRKDFEAQEEKYYLITFEDSYDDGFGGNHSFCNTKAIRTKSLLYPIYEKMEGIISKDEITEEEYDDYNEV